MIHNNSYFHLPFIFCDILKFRNSPLLNCILPIFLTKQFYQLPQKKKLYILQSENCRYLDLFGNAFKGQVCTINNKVCILNEYSKSQKDWL